MLDNKWEHDGHRESGCGRWGVRAQHPEGPLHQLFSHYYIDGKYHMMVHRVWRVNLQRDCAEFVLALGHII